LQIRPVHFKEIDVRVLYRVAYVPLRIDTFVVASPDDDHSHTLRGQLEGNFFSDAVSAAGNESDFALRVDSLYRRRRVMR
jgi:hypothetical protein